MLKAGQKKGKAKAVDADDNRWRMDKFQLNTKGCCFICLQKVIGRTRQVQKGSFSSLRFLTRHLKLDLVKILTRRTAAVVQGSSSSSPGLIPEEVLPSLEKSDVRVSLCERCRGTAVKFSGLFQQLEILRMEMGHCLELLQKWMGEADGDPSKLAQFHGLMASDIHSLLYLGIVDEMRKEFAVKCSAAVTNAPPKVRIDRLVNDKDKPNLGKEIATLQSPPKVTPAPAIVNTPTIPKKKRKKKKTVHFIEPELELQKDIEDNTGQDQDKEESCMESVPSPSPATPDDSEDQLDSDPLSDPGSDAASFSPQSLSELSSSPDTTPVVPTPTKEPPEIEIIDLEPETDSEEFTCSLCQQVFPSVDKVTEHFAVVHLPSIRVRLENQIQSIRESGELAASNRDVEDNGVMEEEQEMQEVHTPSTPVTPPPHLPIASNCLESQDSHEKIITNSTAPSPCKITQAFPISDGQKPEEVPVKIIYVGDRPLIVPVSAKKASATDTTSTNLPQHICTKCGKTFRHMNDLYIHVGSTHIRKTRPKWSRKRKAPLNVTALMTSVISEVVTNAQSSISTSAVPDSEPSYEQMDMDMDSGTGDGELGELEVEATSMEGELEVEATSMKGEPEVEATSKEGELDGEATSLKGELEVEATSMEVEATSQTNIISPTIEDIQNHQVQVFSTSRVESLSEVSVTNLIDISNVFHKYPPLGHPTTSTQQVYRYNSSLPVEISVEPYPAASASPSTLASGPYYGLPPPLEANIIINSATGYHECRLCSQVFLDLKSFEFHYNQMHRIIKFGCNLCGKRFASPDDLGRHWEAVHVQRSVDIPVFTSLTEAELLSQPMLYSQPIINYHVTPTSMIPGSECKPGSSTSNQNQ